MSKPDPPPLRQRPRRASCGALDYPHPEGTWPNTVDAPRPPTSHGPGRGDAAAARAQRRSLLRPRPRRASSEIAADIGPTPEQLNQDLDLRDPARARSARPGSGSTTTASSGRAGEPTAGQTRRRSTFDGTVAVVTGGAGGIGRASSALLSPRRQRSSIADVETSAVDACRHRPRARSGPVSGHQVDITDEDEVARWPAR
mgnify:CR=1 FL=1